MNHYATTYKRDYTPPLMPRLRQLAPSSQPRVEKDGVCNCADSQRAFKELLSLGEQSVDWAQLDRTMAWSLDRRLQPVQDGLSLKAAEPEKLQKTCLERKETCCDRSAARFDEDRMKTTYQVDFSDPAAERIARRFKPSMITRKNGEEIKCCPPFTVESQLDCQPRSHPCRSTRIDGSKRVGQNGYLRGDAKKRGRKKEDEAKFEYLPWQTEYRDSIDKIGNTIIRLKLHHAKRKIVPVLAISN